MGHPTKAADRLTGTDGLASDCASRLLDTAGAIVLVLDSQGAIVSFNRHMEELCGYPLPELRGRDWFESFIPEAKRESLRELFAKAIAGDPIVGHVNPIVIKSGEQRLIEWRANPMIDDDGRVLGLLEVGIDITEKREMQAKLLESERLAAIGMLAAVFAHEVGNPLNAMYLQAQMLRRRIDNPDPEQQLGPRVDAMIAEIQRLISLLEDFRSFQRPDRLLLEATDVGAVLSHVLETLGPKAEAEGITLELELAPELPRVAGHANKLKQVFINLCKNALQATPEGGSLRVTTRRVGDRVEIDVADTGGGIPAELDVFAPFVTTKPAGTGLGLPLVREIVSSHGGEVRYDSSPSGTTFTVSLPIPGE